ncbi:exosortase family protein XrtG [Lactobacillaceae bacterium 24-114]
MINFYLLIGIIIWVYLLSLLKRARLTAYYFWIGSIGLFMILSFAFNMYFVWLSSRLITEILKNLEHYIPGYTIISAYNLISLHPSTSSYVNLFINYECSGAIEIFIFESLLCFFPVYSKTEKITLGAVGFCWIVGTNIIRLLFLIAVIDNWGAQYLFIAHSIIGRLFFYTAIIILYYNVFTKAQIIRGWAKKI